MAFFETYFDESGTHEGSDAVVVGGVLADQAEWSSIMDDWQVVLKSAGLPYFHASELANYQGPYSGLNNHTRNELVSELLRVFENHNIFCISIGVWRQEYDRVIAEFPELHLNAYGTCLLMSIGMLISEAKDIDDATIGITIESGARGGSLPIKELEGELLSKTIRDEYKLRDVAWGDKKTFPQLQLADLIAYESYKHQSNLAKGKTEARFSFNRLSEICGGTVGRAPEDAIRSVLERFKKFYS